MGQQCSFGNPTYSPTGSPRRSGSGAKITDFSYTQEQATLKDLFDAIRTGLIVSNAEFTVLPPGITTSARTKFRLGSNLADAVEEEPNGAALVAERDSEDVREESAEEVEEPHVPHVLETTLNGPAWAHTLRLRLNVEPFVGPFAGRKLTFSWSENTLRAEGSKPGELNSRTIPDFFEDETDFCKCCFLLAYHIDPSNNFNPNVEQNDTETASGEMSLATLKMTAYQTVISNLDAIPQWADLPTKFYHLLYGSQGPVDVVIRVWPRSHATIFGSDPKIRVKSGILFAEFFCLFQARFNLPPSYSVKFYHNFMPIYFNDVVSSNYQTIDCFVTQNSGSNSVYGSYSSGLDVVVDENAALVVSLVGYGVKDITASLDMTVSNFDLLLRTQFSLKEDSFLLISAEDDYTPKYTSYDNWKCVYSFALPDSSFGAGLRRSLRKISFSRRQSIEGQRQRQLPHDQLSQALAPHLGKVTKFLSSNSRHFPSNLDKYGFHIEQIRQMMPMYKMTIDQCGIHPFTVIQVFEVTGPSIPVTFRVISGSKDTFHSPSVTTITRQDGSPAQPQHRTRLTNIMDINPTWPLCTFFRYVDAIVSPGSAIRRKKRLAMGEQSLEDWEEQPELTLGQLLDQWKPAWWPMEGSERRTLTIKDINPSEFLVIEKY